jgi:16S rRNA (guanine527-N7)-methyltransferase
MPIEPTTPDLGDSARALGLDLADDQLGGIADFERLLRERAIPLGHIAASDERRLRQRHVVDSLRAACLVEATDRVALDLGSGAGLPGVVVAIARPRLWVGLVEPRARRAAFLELAVERLRLSNAVVLPHRIQDVDLVADVCFARALAPPAEAWRLAAPNLRRGGRLVYFAGPDTDVAPGSIPPVRGVGPPASIELRADAVLESPGPLAIMTR